MTRESAENFGAALLAEGFRRAPVWLDDAPAAPALEHAPPGSADVAIIGAGYTGLNAALELARGGRSVVVLEKGDLGAGCSSRNGGQISASIKPSLQQLTRRHGEARARGIRAEGRAALEWIEAFVAQEGIDCDFRRAGRFHAAHTPEHFQALAAAAELLGAEEGVETEIVPRAEQARELGTEFYHGGVVYPRHAGLHPAKYHQGLLRAALASGAQVITHCAATALRREATGFLVATERGKIRASEVIVATNGYTSKLTPWLRRRVIPIGSYIIATEALPSALMDRLFPTDRAVSDTRRVVYYYRASPERRHVLFGGRVAARETDPDRSAPLLHAEMRRIFPELASAKISHSWLGFVAYSFDELPHMGVHDGVHYAMGYCGSGVSLASYLGMRLGRRLLGLPDGASAFDGLPFPSRVFYTGRPWFLPAAVAWYRRRDRAECRRAARAAP